MATKQLPESRLGSSPRNTRPTSPPARRKNVPLSPLALKMQADLQLAGLGERTQESYLRSVRKFAQWLKRAPDQASENDLRRYLLFIKNDQQWEGNSLRVAYAGIKFFYTHTCVREWATLHKLRVPRQSKLPAVLSVQEVDQLLGVIRKPALQCFFWTVYSLGLRLQEALHLQIEDIESQRMMVHIRRGKGHKDRLVPLPPDTLRRLRAHWATHRNPQWLFPREGRDHQQAATATQPIDATTIQGCIKKAVAQLGWGKRGISTHTLRHSYATHLLESGVNLRQIQKYMGHSSLQTTTLYLHLTTVGEEIAVAKIQALMAGRQGADHV